VAGRAARFADLSTGTTPIIHRFRLAEPDRPADLTVGAGFPARTLPVQTKHFEVGLHIRIGVVGNA
jgi:hypothetical protein